MPPIVSPVVPVALLVEVALLEEVSLPVIEVSFPPVTVCDMVVLSPDIDPPDVAFEEVAFEVDDMSLPVSDVVSVSLASGTSKIIAAMRPLAENVDPSAAVEVWFDPVALVPVPEVAFVVVPVVEVSLPVVVVVAFCATAGARLNAAAKSPKTSTNATATGAFFIALSMQERILTIISLK